VSGWIKKIPRVSFGTLTAKRADTKGSFFAQNGMIDTMTQNAAPQQAIYTKPAVVGKLKVKC